MISQSGNSVLISDSFNNLISFTYSKAFCLLGRVIHPHTVKYLASEICICFGSQ